MRKDQKYVPKAADMRRAAGEVLATDGNRLRLILASLVLLAGGMLYVMLDMARYYLVYAVGGASVWADRIGTLCATVIALLPTCFFLLPLAYGLLTVAHKANRSENAVLGNVLDAFSDRAVYKRVLPVSWATLWRISLCALAVWLTFAWARESASVGIAFLGAALIALEVVLLVLLTAKRFFVPYLVVGLGYSYRDAVGISRRMAEQNPRCAQSYLFDYLPRLLLSFLTLGVLFFADTLPRMLVSYCKLSQETREMIIRSEEMIDHE